jgi:two-component system, NtrC family, sensor kinase
VEEEYDLAYMRADIADLLKDCSDGTERVQKIVHEMRYFAHQGQQLYENIALGALIEPVLQGFRAQIKDKIQLTTTLGEGLAVPCNPPHMEEVFRQLMRNALEAMPEGGGLSIEARLETDHVHIVVSDTGAGIPEENIGKIFDPFYTTKSVGSGTGMGLNTVYNIITVHGGTISAASTPGKGTTFTIQLPLAR